MKIGLVIFHFTHSHGSILQNYALYKTLKDMGHEVTVINDKINTSSRLYFIKRSIYNLLKAILGLYNGKIVYRGHDYQNLMTNLNTFINEQFGNDVFNFYSDDELRKYVNLNEFDAFVVGSDQTWRPIFVRNIYYYYLDFAEFFKSVKRIAYVPSLGTDEWEYTDEQTLRCRELIKKFDAVSVREISSVNIIKERLGIDVKWLLDPTFLIKKEDYSLIAKIRNDNSKQLSYSILDMSESKKSFVKLISENLGLVPIRINGKENDYNAPPNERIAPGIEQWLSGIKNSKFVITDSFHATVFAIIFNVPFLTIANNRRGFARFDTLLSYFNLKERLVMNINTFDKGILKRQIEWNLINNQIKLKRNEGLNFLSNALKK